MNNKTIAIIGGIVVLLGIAYVGRKALKQMYSAPVSTQYAPADTSNPANTGTTSATSGGSSLYQMKTSSKLGQYMTDPNGMTLYTWTKDSAGVSNCTGQCLVNWPAYTVQSIPANMPPGMGTIKRADGSTQLTWKSMPLYFYINDKAPGDTSGDGVGGSWYVAK